MKVFLLTVTLLAVSAYAAPGGKVKRDILPGDKRYGTDYHLHHHHVHDTKTAYLPPNQPQVNNQYSAPVAQAPVAQQTFELPSTSYGTPFNAPSRKAPSAPITSYGTPVVPETHHHVEQHVEHHHAAPAPVPHQSYGVPHVHHQPAPVHHQPAQVHYQPAPVHHQPAQVHYQPAPAPAPVPHQSYGVPQVHHQPAPVHHQPAQVHYQPAPAPAPVPHQSYGAPQVHHQPAPVHHQPAQVHYQPAPVHHQPAQVHYQPASAPAPVPHQSYGAPEQHHQHHETHNTGYTYQQQEQHHHVAQEKLVFEAPIRSVEVAHTHSVETVPAPVQVSQDTVSVEAVGVRNSGYSYPQPAAPQQATDSNGGYVY